MSKEKKSNYYDKLYAKLAYDMIHNDDKSFMPKSKCWDSGSFEYVTSCSEVKTPEIYVNNIFLGKVKFLLEKFPNTEWAVDLLGHKENSNFYIEDLYVFKQEVSYATVKRLEPSPAGSIGCTHSHHQMGAFFSETDDDFPNNNHDLSGVIASTPFQNFPFTIMFTVRVKTPCNKYIRFNNVPVKLQVENVVVNDIENKINENHILNSFPYDNTTI